VLLYVDKYSRLVGATLRSVIKSAFFVSLPILFAYFPVGVIYGLLFVNQGYQWWLAPIASMFIFSGAVQFLMLSAVELQVSTMQIFISALFISLRNSFYGPGLYYRFKHFSKTTVALLAFGLVDASYALLLNKPRKDIKEDEKYCLWLCFFIYSYWVIGTFIGAWLSKSLASSSLKTKGLDFSLTILFVIFALQQYLKYKEWFSLATAVVVWSIAFAICPQYSLSLSISLSALLVMVQQKLMVNKIDKINN